MKIVYFSKTGNIKRLCGKLDKLGIDIIDGNTYKGNSSDIVLITYTCGYGELPVEVEAFCKMYKGDIKYVLASGNRNWSDAFAKAGDHVSRLTNAKLLYKFELSGTNEDLTNITNILLSLKESNA